MVLLGVLRRRKRKPGGSGAGSERPANAARRRSALAPRAPRSSSTSRSWRDVPRRGEHDVRAGVGAPVVGGERARARRVEITSARPITGRPSGCAPKTASAARSWTRSCGCRPPSRSPRARPRARSRRRRTPGAKTMSAITSSARSSAVVGDARVDDRRLARRRRVQLAAELVEDLGDLLRRVARRALEEQVLDEVRDARRARPARPASPSPIQNPSATERTPGSALGDDALAAGELGELRARPRARIVAAAAVAAATLRGRASAPRSRGRACGRRAPPRSSRGAARLARRGVLRPLDQLLGRDEPAVLVLRDELEADPAALLVDLLDDDVERRRRGR